MVSAADSPVEKVAAEVMRRTGIFNFPGNPPLHLGADLTVRDLPDGSPDGSKVHSDQ